MKIFVLKNSFNEYLLCVANGFCHRTARKSSAQKCYDLKQAEELRKQANTRKKEWEIEEY